MDRRDCKRFLSK